MTPTTGTQKNSLLSSTNRIFIDAYNNHEKGLRAYAYFKVQDTAICDDLIQETFLKTWKYLAKEKNIKQMKPFLYHVLNCLIIDEYRKNKSASLDSLLEKGYEPEAGDFTRVIDIHDGTNASRLIEHLPNKYRSVIYMRYMQELSIHEISSITAQSRNTIAVQSHRGLEKLKALYQPE